MFSHLYEKLLSEEKKLAVVGLGYVGMPLAVAFAKKVSVIGFDLNENKINQYRSGIDPTCEVGNDAIKSTSVMFTNNENRLREASFHIIAVPTPINHDKTPDLSPVIGASAILGRNLTPGSVVVYESTVYPGVTEEVCIPILEKESGLICGVDFKIGYSPERINPGDREHRLENIRKIVSGMDEETLDVIAKVYELVIMAGVHRASSIKVAEAAKVVENSQRDINIAFMNELALVFDRMNINTAEVVEAMNTKWNALGFRPGLVGGHCIGVDPYYFVYEAERLGYHSQIILSGRKINDDMGAYISSVIIKKLVLAKKRVCNAKVIIFGITFKEDCPDTRNSKVNDIILSLKEYGVTPIVIDPIANAADAEYEYGVKLQPMEAAQDADCLVYAVAHKPFREMTLDQADALFTHCPACEKVFIDIKSIFPMAELERRGWRCWQL